MTKLPKSIDEAVEILLSEVGDKDRSMLSKYAKDDLITFHHTLGQSIRNEFELWGGNDELVKDASKFISDLHPDSISMLIIEKYWEKVRQR